jgi:hypothetical protein
VVGLGCGSAAALADVHTVASVPMLIVTARARTTRVSFVNAERARQRHETSDAAERASALRRGTACQ